MESRDVATNMKNRSATTDMESRGVVTDGVAADDMASRGRFH